MSQELSASLPNIVINQRVRTLYDIFDDASKEILKRTNNVKDIVHDLLDFLEDCIDISIVLAIVGISATIGGGIYAGFSQSSLQSVGQTFAGLGSATGSMMSGWTEFCRLVDTQYELAIKTEEIELELLEMETCLEVVQRQIDLGLCREQEQNCFNEVVECVDFGNINREINDIERITQETSDIARSLGDDLEDIGEGIEEADFLGPDRGKFRIIWDSSTSSNICQYEQRYRSGYSYYGYGGTVTQTQNCQPSELRFEFYDYERCDRQGGEPKAKLEATGQIFDDRSSAPASLVFPSPGPYTFTVFCDRNLNDQKDSGEQNLGTYDVKYLEAMPDHNLCSSCSIFSRMVVGNGELLGPDVFYCHNASPDPEDYNLGAFF